MTTNKPEVKRYNITTDKDYYPVPYETEHGQWVKYSSYKALQAECERWKNSASGAHQQLTADRIETEKLADYWGETMAESAADVNDAERELETLKAECEKLRKDAEIGRSVREKAYPGASYGCYCDLEEGMQPDGCVIDSDERHDCIYAAHIEVKEQCKYWKIIATDIDTVEGSK